MKLSWQEFNKASGLWSWETADGKFSVHFNQVWLVLTDLDIVEFFTFDPCDRHTNPLVRKDLRTGRSAYDIEFVLTPYLGREMSALVADDVIEILLNKGVKAMNVTITDDRGNTKEIELMPDEMVNPTDYLFPCGICGKAVLLEKMTSEGHCNICDPPPAKDEDIVMLEQLGWAYEHPGYFKKDYTRCTVLINYEYAGFYVQDPDVYGVSPVYQIDSDCDNIKEALRVIEATGLVEEIEAANLEMQIETAFHFFCGWDMEGGSLMYPDGIMIFRKNMPHGVRIELPMALFSDPENHEGLSELADGVVKLLNKIVR